MSPWPDDTSTRGPRVQVPAARCAAQPAGAHRNLLCPAAPSPPPLPGRHQARPLDLPPSLSTSRPPAPPRGGRAPVTGKQPACDEHCRSEWSGWALGLMSSPGEPPRPPCSRCWETEARRGSGRPPTPLRAHQNTHLNVSHKSQLSVVPGDKPKLLRATRQPLPLSLPVSLPCPRRAHQPPRCHPLCTHVSPGAQSWTLQDTRDRRSPRPRVCSVSPGVSCTDQGHGTLSTSGH